MPQSAQHCACWAGAEVAGRKAFASFVASNACGVGCGWSRDDWPSLLWLHPRAWMQPLIVACTHQRVKASLHRDRDLAGERGSCCCEAVESHSSITTNQQAPQQINHIETLATIAFVVVVKTQPGPLPLPPQVLEVWPRHGLRAASYST